MNLRNFKGTIPRVFGRCKRFPDHLEYGGVGSGSQYENENRSHLAAAAASRSAGNRAADDTDYPDVLSISVIRVIRGFVRAVRI
jgi:hypothetical protein